MIPSSQFNKKADDFLKDLWENRAVGLPTESLDKLSPAALAHLRNQFPYLQMISSEAVIEENISPRFKKAPCGWVIHDYGQAMSTSPGKHLYGPGNPELADEDQGGDTGAGTLVWKSYEAAVAMIELAIEKGWPGVEIVAGTPFMQWAAWMAAQDKNYLLIGYEPSAAEKQKRERIRRLQQERGMEQGPEPEIGPSLANE